MTAHRTKSPVNPSPGSDPAVCPVFDTSTGSNVWAWPTAGRTSAASATIAMMMLKGSSLINACCSPRMPCAGSFRRTVTAAVRDEGGLERGGRCGRASRDSAASALGTPASRPLRATAAEWPRFPAAFARAAGIGGRTVRSHSHGTLLTFASWRVAGCPARAVPRTGQRRRPCDGSDVSGELLAVGTGLPSFSRRRRSAGWAARCKGPPRRGADRRPLNERLAIERLRTLRSI